MQLELMAVTPNLDVRFGGIAMSRLMMTAGLMMLAATVPAAAGGLVEAGELELRTDFLAGHAQSNSLSIRTERIMNIGWIGGRNRGG
ncbi:MAG TPA: hypothetical protein VIF39_13255 [Hyphomicrobium sp.]